MIMRAQRGVGLVELMVSIVIGMVLLLGLGTFLSSMNQTYKMRQSMSAVQNSQRNAMTFLSAIIQNAGYNPSPLSVAAIAIPLTGTGSASGVPGTDTLTVRFIPASGVSGFQGCSPNLVQGNTYTNRFSVDAASRTLRCAETNVTTNTAVTVDLIRGVQGMNVLYGVDTTTSGSVTQYLPATGATSVDSLALWPRVKTVKVTLQFDNPLAGDAGQTATPRDLTQTIPLMIGL